VLTTLLKNEYKVAEIGSGRAMELAGLLFKALHGQNGLLGFGKFSKV
jgi:hypothetical protein